MAGSTRWLSSSAKGCKDLGPTVFSAADDHPFFFFRAGALPVLDGDDFLFELLGDVDELQGLLDLTPHVFHLPLHACNRSFRLLKLSLLCVDLK